MKSDFLVFLVPLALILALVFSPRLRRARVRDRLRTAWGEGAPGRTLEKELVEDEAAAWRVLSGALPPEDTVDDITWQDLDMDAVFCRLDNCPTETGFAPDIGAIMAFIEASTGRRADLVVGKPHTGIVQAALRRTGLAVDQLAMVGDRLYTDIETGLKSGMLSILVMSGETTPEMLAAYPHKPDLVFDRLAEMIPLL